MDGLEHEALMVATRAFADSTALKYDSGQFYFARFLCAAGMQRYWLTWENREWVFTLYTTFLARSCAYKTIKGYLQGVRVLYMERDLGHPYQGLYKFGQHLKGLKRILGDATVPKLPITPFILCQIAARLRRGFTALDLASFVAMLIGFFGMLRKANLGVDPACLFPSGAMIRRRDFTFDPASYSFMVAVRLTKTTQCKEKVLMVPIQGCKGSLIDPYFWVTTLFEHVPAGPEDHAFAVPARRAGANVPALQALSRGLLVTFIKRHVALAGLDSARYAGHSLRRGGAMFAFLAGAASEMIKLQGDWISDAYQIYLNFPPGVRLQVTRRMLEAISHGEFGAALHARGPS
jgi:hypothetical protein